MLLNFNVLLRLNLAILLLIISPIAGGIKTPMKATNLPEIFPTKEEWAHGKMNPEKPFPTPKDQEPLVSIFRENFAPSPDTCVDGLEDLTPAEEKHMKISWAKKKEDVLLLESQTHSIYESISHLLKRLDDVVSHLESYKSQGLKEQLQKYIESLGVKLQKRIDILKKIRYVEFLSARKLKKNIIYELIRDYNNNKITKEQADQLYLPPDLVDRLYMQATGNVGNSIINDLKEPLFNLQLLREAVTYRFEFHYIANYLWKINLRMVDLLQAHGFIDPITVQNFFQRIFKNPEMIKQLLLFVESRTPHKFRDEMSLSYWTTDLNWKRLRRSFKALSKRRDLIDAYMLLYLNHHQILEPLTLEKNRNTTLKLRFFAEFGTEDYWPFLENMANAELDQKVMQKELKEAFTQKRVNVMAELLQIEPADTSDLELAYHLLSIWDFVKGKIDPDVADIFLRQGIEGNRFEEKLKLLRLGANLEALMLRGQGLASKLRGRRPADMSFEPELIQVFTKARNTYDQLLGPSTREAWHNAFPNVMNMLQQRHQIIKIRSPNFMLTRRPNNDNVLVAVM